MNVPSWHIDANGIDLFATHVNKPPLWRWAKFPKAIIGNPNDTAAGAEFKTKVATRSVIHISIVRVENSYACHVARGSEMKLDPSGSYIQR